MDPLRKTPANHRSRRRLWNEFAPAAVPLLNQLETGEFPKFQQPVKRRDNLSLEPAWLKIVAAMFHEWSKTGPDCLPLAKRPASLETAPRRTLSRFGHRQTRPRQPRHRQNRNPQCPQHRARHRRRPRRRPQPMNPNSNRLAGRDPTMETATGNGKHAARHGIPARSRS